jgi:hypothetical protein
MIDGVGVQLSEATESSVRVTLAASGHVDLTGAWELYGPRCEYGRTLASTFRNRATSDGSVEFLVTEPCYWSPTMPFLYELRRTGELGDGETHSLGLGQLIAHGRNLRLGGERIVLRGAACHSLDEQTAQRAHAAESAVVLSAYDDAALAAASRWGALAIVDATEFEGELATLVAKLSWRPAAAILLLRREQLESTHELRSMGRPLLLAQECDPLEWNKANSVAAVSNVVVALLRAGERPPPWTATCGQPVVAIRRGGTYADFQQARAACDRLQAELAPEFDLAGYFVGPV